MLGGVCHIWCVLCAKQYFVGDAHELCLVGLAVYNECFFW